MNIIENIKNLSLFGFIVENKELENLPIITAIKNDDNEVIALGYEVSDSVKDENISSLPYFSTIDKYLTTYDTEGIKFKSGNFLIYFLFNSSYIWCMQSNQTIPLFIRNDDIDKFILLLKDTHFGSNSPNKSKEVKIQELENELIKKEEELKEHKNLLSQLTSKINTIKIEHDDIKKEYKIYKLFLEQLKDEISRFYLSSIPEVQLKSLLSFLNKTKISLFNSLVPLESIDINYSLCFPSLLLKVPYKERTEVDIQLIINLTKHRYYLIDIKGETIEINNNDFNDFIYGYSLNYPDVKKINQVPFVTLSKQTLGNRLA